MKKKSQDLTGLTQALATLDARAIAKRRRKVEFTGEKSVLEYSVHQAIKDRLDAVGAYHVWDLPNVDCIGCYNGQFFAIQVMNAHKFAALRPDQKPTTERIRKAGGEVFVIDSAEAAEKLFIKIKDA
jgi:hypothetical protein